MAVRDSMLPEYDQEIATTRRFLERIPERDAGWRPHAKSMPLGDLAVHIAALPWWLAMTLTTTEVDVATMPQPPAFATTAELLARFDANAAAGRAALARATEADLALAWSLRSGAQVFFTAPRGAVLRSFVLSHLIHHRAQLGVYLRLRDVPLPFCYGPSADSAG
ncbi:MAG TPA: DinB family protein [bacterium]